MYTALSHTPIHQVVHLYHVEHDSLWSPNQRDAYPRNTYTHAHTHTCTHDMHTHTPHRPTATLTFEKLLEVSAGLLGLKT